MFQNNIAKSISNTEIVNESASLSEIKLIVLDSLHSIPDVRLDNNTVNERLDKGVDLLKQDEYGNTLFHYVISSNIPEHVKLYFIKKYLTKIEYFPINFDKISLLDLAIIKNERILTQHIIKNFKSYITSESILFSYKLFLLFEQNTPHINKLFIDHFTFLRRHKEGINQIFCKLYNNMGNDTPIIQYITELFGTEACSELESVLNKKYKCNNFKLLTQDKWSFKITYLNMHIPTVIACMAEYYIPTCYTCIKVAEETAEGYILSREPASPIRYSLHLYCEWYLITIKTHIRLRGLTSLSIMGILQSLFKFIHSMSLWFSNYHGVNGIEGKLLIKNLFKTFMKELLQLSTNLNSNFDYKLFCRLFAPINIFFLTKLLLFSNFTDYDKQFLDFCIECEFDINTKDLFGYLPIHILFQCNNKAKETICEDFYNYFFSHNFYPLARDYTGSNTFDIASKNDIKMLNTYISNTAYTKPYSLKTLTATFIADICNNASCRESNYLFSLLPAKLRYYVMLHQKPKPLCQIMGFTEHSIFCQLIDDDLKFFLELNK